MLGVCKKQPVIPYQHSAKSSGDETTITTWSVVKTGVIEGPDAALPCTAVLCRGPRQRGKGGGFLVGRMLWQPVVTKVKSGPFTSLPGTHPLTACSQQCYMATKGTIKPLPNDNPPWMCLYTDVFTVVHNATAYSWKHTWSPDAVQVLGAWSPG